MVLPCKLGVLPGELAEIDRIDKRSFSGQGQGGDLREGQAGFVGEAFEEARVLEPAAQGARDGGRVEGINRFSFDRMNRIGGISAGLHLTYGAAERRPVEFFRAGRGGGAMRELVFAKEAVEGMTAKEIETEAMIAVRDGAVVEKLWGDKPAGTDALAEDGLVAIPHETLHRNLVCEAAVKHLIFYHGLRGFTRIHVHIKYQR